MTHKTFKSCFTDTNSSCIITNTFDWAFSISRTIKFYDPNKRSRYFLFLYAIITCYLLEQSEPCLPSLQEQNPVSTSQMPASLQFDGQIHSKRYQILMLTLFGTGFESKKKCSSSGPPRDNFYKHQQAWKGVKITQFLSALTNRKIGMIVKITWTIRSNC